MTGTTQSHSSLWRLLLIILVFGLAVVIGGVVTKSAFAQETWCSAHPANCVCSEPLTAQSYASQGGGGYFSANDDNAKKCTWAPGNPGWSIWAASGAKPVRKTDSATLALMPNRDPNKVTSYMGTTDGTVNSWMVGNEGTNISNAERVVFRFYLYRSPNYQFANEGSCTNGKTAEVIASGSQGSEIIFTSDGGVNKSYGFVNSTWAWGGASSFDGWTHGPAGADGDPGSHWTLGKWTRHEIVVKRPRAGQGGTDVEWYMADVTNGGPLKQVMKMSNACTGCIFLNGSVSDWRWDSSARPLNDLVDYAANMYRAGSCSGWNGLSHYVLATFPTDNGQMIGPAVEVEGGSSMTPPAAPSGLSVK